MTKMRALTCLTVLLLPVALGVACGGDSEASRPSTGGTGASSGSGGSGGSGATGGTGGATGGTGGATGGTGGATGGTGGDAGGGGSAGAQDASVDAPPDADPACATIPENGTTTAHLRITADNECEVFVNGTSVGTTNNWAAAVSIDVSLFVHPSKKNVIAVKGTNTSSQSGNDRGIIGELTLALDGAVTALVLTDASWRVATSEVAGWTDVTFDDSAWTSAVEIADHGAAPWGNIMTTTGAKWVWSALVPVSTSDKPNLESAWVRRTFYVSTSGTAVTDTPGCP